MGPKSHTTFILIYNQEREPAYLYGDSLYLGALNSQSPVLASGSIAATDSHQELWLPCIQPSITSVEMTPPPPHFTGTTCTGDGAEPHHYFFSHRDGEDLLSYNGSFSSVNPRGA
ncbi:hypothetical protein AVEN_74366-1 [Araneus ventricosus]|uniref:Uncharacterized protein n=1 Tax=Araneus ventricosus TaxID=182803 RepID=A0A4Y2SGU5_ARAVE|nr:hypothetical protein AVEN_74366-1 [Araneus ventricosus]